MKERPIIFSAPMVLALLDGNKTQTRRVVKQRKDLGFGVVLTPGELAGEVNNGDFMNCPYGRPGDRLWVKETTVNVEDFGYVGPVYAESDHGRNVLGYGLAPSEDDFTEVEPEDIKLRPSIFMPRSMSRITLEITRIRIERLQDISESDAKAEGTSQHPDGPWHAYRSLWTLINGDGSWEANPFVWVIEFKKVEAA